MSEKLLEEIEKRLNAKTIHDLRQVARAVGVPRPADGRKERILEYILQIAEGKSNPVAPAVRGAHPKSAEYDRHLVADILRCREINLSETEAAEEKSVELSVASGAEFSSAGILEKDGDKWFIRGSCDIAVNPQFAQRYKLREGDCVSGVCTRASEGGMPLLTSINSVNGVSPDSIAGRADFERLTPIYPDVRLKTARGADDITGRMIDLFSPVGKGQRAVVVGRHGTGKTAILKEIVKGIRFNNPEVKIIFAAVDTAPEEAAEIRRTFSDCDVFTSPFDAGADAHIRTARLALEYAKRQAESLKDVLLVLDDLSGLTRAYNSTGLVSSELSTSALDSAKKFLAGAKNAAEGGSLTILTALNPDGVLTDGAAYYGLKDLCNMRVSLSSKLARSRIFPPIDIEETYTNGDEKLLSSEDIERAAALRGKTYAEVVGILKQS